MDEVPTDFEHRNGMTVRLIRPTGARLCDLAELPALLGDQDGLVWVDVPLTGPDEAALLRDVLHLHPQAVEDCARRSTAPKLHLYPDTAFLVLHAPELGPRGHVHSIELDLFIGRRLLVTVHGPLNPAVDPALAVVETAPVAARIDAGRWRPASVEELAHAVVTGLNRRMNHHLATLTGDIWQLERRVTGGGLGNPEQFLEEMFRVRHALQAIRTMAALDLEVYDRMARIRPALGGDPSLAADSIDQFQRIRTAAETQKEHLQGIIEFYQARTNTKMTIAAERLAVIAAVTLPVTAVSSIVGMNVIVSDSTRYPALAVLLLAMAAMSAWLLIWCKRRGWW